MTSRRSALELCLGDEVDGLVRRALRDSLGQVQPPAYVWERLEQKARCRMAGKAVRYVLGSVWAEIWRNMRRRVTGRTRQYVGRDRLYWPIEVFDCWEGCIPLSLVYIIEQPMPILRGVGWAA
jgi:hypothetical protein